MQHCSHLGWYLTGNVNIFVIGKSFQSCFGEMQEREKIRKLIDVWFFFQILARYMLDPR